MIISQSQEENDHRLQQDKNITVDNPGVKVQLPIYVIKQLQDFWPNYKKRLTFFGGHPVSMTKQSCNQIFTSLNQKGQSPYLVCQKTDGVRYLLIVARVKKSELMRQTYPDEQNLYTQCYLVSRQGQGKLVTYAVNLGVSYLMQPASTEMENGRKYITSVLDGEIIFQRGDKMRFLIFDGLIHLGRNICPLTLKQRLECVTNFMRCNDMLGVQRHAIEIKIKDFFRLTCRKFNMSQFMLKKYIKCLPHQNDGLIFNNEQKQYILGATNPGYIKWKPAHLNTVDFMIIPNQNLEDRLNTGRVLDLYLAIYDPELDRYTSQFYTYTIVSESDFKNFLNIKEKFMLQAHEQIQANNNEESISVNDFVGAIIAECRYEATKNDQRVILNRLARTPVDELIGDLMKQSQEERDAKAIKQFQNQICDKGWKIYKLRQDKSLPNNSQVVKKIEESIRDGIREDQLIKKCQELNRK